MLINDNEYGAPWNDQFYVVTYKDEDTDCIYSEHMVLDGPRTYTSDELKVFAEGGFPGKLILKVEPYEIRR